MPPELVAPFRGERYTAADRLSQLIAPPYDVISRDARARLAAADEHNIVHVILPEAPAGWPGSDKYAWAAAQLGEWRKAGGLARDPEPAVYVMAQDFALPSGERRTRFGMFAAVAAEGYESRRIRPHEKTHAGPKADRLALLRATRTSLESIFLLAPDPDGALAAALTGVATTTPDARGELEGVGIRLWVVAGEATARFTSPGSRFPLYIADGHHRYETASAYAKEDPAADRMLGFIVSAGDAGLSVLPTHRVIFGGGREPAPLLPQWERWFAVERLAPGTDRLAWLADAGVGRTACVVAWSGGPDFGLALKPDAPLDEVADLGKTPAVRSLDVARVETLVVKAIVRAGTTTVTMDYTPDPAQALAKVRPGGATAAVLLHPTPVDQVLAVADAGDVMPPKSTYFIPKVPSGVVLRPL
ncbi:MAG: DUF1015 domain-containing protein [Gemmatimonadetes bacterium]|nr:DUF1015 domain-containing protein [Gemmatimonadota bacterium]